jgi:hypothetical protein
MFFSEASTLKFLRKSSSQGTNKGSPDEQYLHSPEWSEAKDDSGKIRIERTCSATALLLEKNLAASHESLNVWSKKGYRAVLQAALVAWLSSRAEATETECERARKDRSIARVLVRRYLLCCWLTIKFSLYLPSWIAYRCPTDSDVGAGCCSQR